MADEVKSSPPAKVEVEYEKASDFISRYANNVFLESSAWDLKMIFGELDQSKVPNKVERRVAVTIPWAQAKLLMFYLRVHIKAEEMQDGKIHIRPDLRPTESPALTEEQAKDAKFVEFYEFVKRLREDFIADA